MGGAHANAKLIDRQTTCDCRLTALLTPIAF